MKRILLYILFLISAVTFSQASKVKVETNRTDIRIGEQFEYKISVDETEGVTLPKLENLRGLEVVDTLRIDTIKKQLIRKYILTGFDSGAFHIPRQQVFIKNRAFLTDSLLINVVTVPVDTTKIKQFPIKGIKGEPLVFDDYKHFIYWIIGILLLAGIVLYFALKRTQNTETYTSESLLSPYKEALRNLDVLDKKLLWQNNKIKEYYSELTDVLRNYIERELHVSAMETTTDGLVETLSDFNDADTILTDTETIKKLESLLKQADLVKFAKSKPMAHIIESDRNIASHILDNLKPNIKETDIDVNNIQEVILVEKPIIKKPSIITRIILILLILAIAFGFAYAISNAQKMSNSLKSPIHNVQ